MKRITLGLLVLVFILAFSPRSFAWFWNKDSAEQATVEKDAAASASKPAAAGVPREVKSVKPKKEADKAASASDKARIEADKAHRALIEQKRREMNNTEWAIDLSKLTGKGKKETDTVTFKTNQVFAGGYVKKGFQPTNYSLSIQGDGNFVWETMQSSEKSGLAFWRGEISADMQSMRGVLSHQISDKAKEEYSFVSTAKNIVSAE
ncbi:MAG: hypothetical protein PHH68_07995 [Candidatus Omnitrophica bacterium]|nr:hypothetical protein [Candidatus Omnitrophota bacterium]MDD5078698.1 hypothetical protein [Candidatus Omnitrophota bacterium]MDD5080239.1 hypothetical protein [Candidatus Omnitrophota bacterium]